MNFEDTRKALGDNVTRLLERYPNARKDLAQRIGIGDRTLGRIEANDGNPRLDSIVQLASFFRVQPWELLRSDLGAKSKLDNDRSFRENADNQIDVNDLSESINLVTELLDKRGEMLPRHLFARAVALVYSQRGLYDQAVIGDNVVALIRKSTK